MIVENINKLKNAEFINIFKNIFEHSDFITHEVEGLRPFQNKLDVIDSFIKVFDNLTIDNIEELIEIKLKKEKEKLIAEWVDEGIKLEKGRWGRSVISMGKKKIEIPKEIDPKTITLDIAKEYLNPKKKK